MKKIYPDFLKKYLLILRQYKRRKKHVDQCISRLCGETKRILMSENDYYRLLNILKTQKKSGLIKRTFLSKFRVLLKRMGIQPVSLIPYNIITMNSQITVLTSEGKSLELHLVYPDKKNKNADRISIFSWMGMCLIGKKEGDRIRKNLFIDKVMYQPEANDDFHL